MITQQRLKQLLSYDPVTGAFAWRSQRRGTVSMSSPNGCPVGCRHPDGRLVVTIDGRTHTGSRLAWLYVHGKLPDGNLRHKDGNPRNTAIDNLEVTKRGRPASPHGAMPTRSTRRQPNGTAASPYICSADGAFRVRGITFDKPRGKWVARPTIDGKRKLLGYFDTELDAQNAVIKAFARP